MDKLRTCFFTGHRIISNKNIAHIKELISSHMEDLIIKYDVNTFISGGALGFDTIAAEAVIEMRKKYPHIRLIMYLPCYGQETKWTLGQKYRYRMVLSGVNKSIYITEGKYTADCMQIRNMKMIEDSFFCIAYCTMPRSGTGATLRKIKEGKIINIADEINAV